MLPVLAPGRYFGERRRCRTVPGVTLVENAYAPGFVIPRHAHASAFFGMVLEGGYREHYDNRCRECGPSALLFHPPGEVHSEMHYDVVVRILSIEPSERLLAHLGEHARALDGPQELRGGSVLRLAARLYEEFRSDDPLAPLAMEGIALELLACILRQGAVRASTAPRWLAAARDLLHERVGENLSLSEIAAAIGVHPAHLARTFRRHYGCTVGDHLRNLRAERARQELKNSDRPLAELALALGYADQSHFVNSFRRQTGMTPGAFRKAHRAPK
jgi:AraC family transcriptional regulator